MLFSKKACAAVLFAALQTVHAQSILGTNLIQNGNAEAGPAGSSTKVVSSIPGWPRYKNINVLSYDVPGLAPLSDPAPPDHGFQYFAGATGGPPPGTLEQDIDVSPVATTLGPLKTSAPGMSLQQQLGLVPAGTVLITVTLSLSAVNGLAGTADSLSLVLNTLGTSPGSVLGTNLVVNGSAETGPAVPLPKTTLYVPGWSTANTASVAPYGGTRWIAVTDPGPADRGVNLFCGGVGAGNSYQDIDISPAASLIDSGQVTYEVSAWLGSLPGVATPTLTYVFYDWSGKQLAPTAQLGPVSLFATSLVERSQPGIVPAGARRVHIALSFPTRDSLADDIAFTLAAPSGPPVITPGGILTAGAYGGSLSIAPGSWIEIYGANLTASAPLGWSGSDFRNGVAPTKLGDVGVSVGGKAAFIDYISAGQVNALVPSSDGFPIYVNPTQPGLLAPGAFVINGKQYVAALFPDGQTFALPQNAISGVASRPAKIGETVIIYGVVSIQRDRAQG